MDKPSFDELCENTFAGLAKEIKLTIKDFPDDISLADNEILNYNKLMLLMKNPVILKVNENKELYYTTKDGDKVFIDPRVENDTILKDYVEDVSRLLPEVPFDLNCGGNKRKQQEVAAAYTVCVINAFLNKVYASEISDCANSYDFDACRSKTFSGKTFADIFKLIQEDATPIVKFLITCCFTVLSESKEKNEALYTGIVSQKDQEVLDQMKSEIKDLEIKCNKLVEKEPKKLNRLILIKEKDDKIKALFIRYGRKYEVLFGIYKLNSSNLNPVDTPTIKQGARKEAKRLLDEGLLTDQDYYKKFVTRQSQKAIRMRVKSMKTDLFEKFSNITDGNYEGLIPKN